MCNNVAGHSVWICLFSPFFVRPSVAKVHIWSEKYNNRLPYGTPFSFFYKNYEKRVQKICT